jgi:Iap family predicted aminopeptidase
MRRANDLLGVASIFIGTVAVLLGGCTQPDSQSDSGGRAAVDNSAAASNELPEVVITAPRSTSKTIVLSARDAARAGQ